MRDVEVYFDQELVGRLTIGTGIRPVVSFQYSSSWLGRADPFAIDPELALSSAPYSRAGSLFGALRDSAPDAWGRGLLARSSQGQILGEADYLLGVSDESRQGALRYRDPDGTWLTDVAPVPVLMNLPHLQQAAREAESGRGAPIRELAAAGAGTGGARPKVMVQDEGELWIAKFGRRDDEIQTESAEFVVAQLARRAGVSMSPVRLERGSLEPILLTRRFDRDGDRRRGYLSALSLLEHEIGPGRDGLYDYLELADVLPLWSSQPTEDLQQLWRRIAFGSVIRNTDDHMRNHAFVRVQGRWRLSPAFDLNTDVRSWVPFVTAVDGEIDDGRLSALLVNRDYFRMGESQCREVLAEVVAAAESVGSLLDEWIPVDTREALSQTIADGVRMARRHLEAR